MNQHQTQIRVLAISVWDSEQDADSFLNTPHDLLENRTPIEISASEAGAEQVAAILENIRWGLPR